MEFIHYLTKILLKQFLKVFYVFAVEQKKIFLLNELSFTYGDNLKYISEYVQAKDDNYKIIYPLKSKEKLLNVTIVKPYSFNYFRHLLTSRIIITNAGGISYLPLRKNQTCINTWHGGGPYKKTAAAVYTNKWYLKELKLNKDSTKHIVSSCELCTKLEASAMLFEHKDCLDIGSPRNDIFFTQNNDIKDKVYSHFNIEKTKKIVLFAPTFRNNATSFTSSKEIFDSNLNFEKLTEVLNLKFGGDWIVGIRLHPKLKKCMISYPNAINFSLYPDVQELLYSSDVVITDYSSLMWDFSLTNRPCFLFAEDLDEYESTRGFYMDSSKWPYPISKTNEELFNTIKNFNNKKYLIDIEKHHKECGSYEQGNACQKIYTVIQKNLKE